MYQGHLGKRHGDHDHGQTTPLRERTDYENVSLSKLTNVEYDIRTFITTLADVDGRCKATALTKLDEMVMWIKKGIDA